MGELIWNEVKERGLQINDENVGFIANEMREKHGSDIWAKKTVEKVRSFDECSLVVIDGVRNSEEMKTFQDELGHDFVLVAVDAKDDIRYERALLRNRADDSKNLDKIKERDQRERAWGIKKIMCKADYIISNNDDLPGFQKKIKELMLTLI
jgi:dephospho-CoA kinase